MTTRRLLTSLVSYFIGISTFYDAYYDLHVPGEGKSGLRCYFNPTTPMSDQDRIFPNNINAISSKQVMRIKKSINHVTISGSNTNTEFFKKKTIIIRQ